MLEFFGLDTLQPTEWVEVTYHVSNAQPDVAEEAPTRQMRSLEGDPLGLDDLAYW